mgnify:CR=1 FL=1
MAVNLPAPVAADLHPVPGVRIGVTEAGIRKAQRKDLTVVLIEPGASVSAVFTRNRFCAAPVQVCREHLAAGQGIRAILVNTGNANAGTGADGGPPDAPAPAPRGATAAAPPGPSSRGAAPTAASVPAAWVAPAWAGWVRLRTTRGVISRTISVLLSTSR